MFNTEGGGEGAGEERNVAVGTDCTLRPVALVVTQPPTQPQPQPATASSDAAEPPVRRVVCSPDLPVFPTYDESAVDSSTGPDRVFKCSFCQKTFSQKNTYQNHLRSHGKEGEDRYQCNYCGKTFAVPARLTRHYRTHTGEKPYQCEYCKKSFSVKENLSVHRRIHTKERPYKCDICERAFEHSGKLHRHMRIHTGERPHKCAICQKTFIQSGQLVIHMRTHTGEKPYVCKSCGKGFTCSKQLKVHSRTHTGEKPYSCEICGKAFGYNHVLKLHQVAHFGEKVYKCTICNQTFTSKKTMEGHIKSHSEPAAPAHSTRPEERSPDVAESSCASSTSDKENKMDTSDRIRVNIPSADSYSNTYIIQNNNNNNNNNAAINNRKDERSEAAPSGSAVPQQPHPNIKELCQYLYPRSSGSPTQQQSLSSGLNPTLLAVVAAAAANEEREEPASHRDIVLMSPVPSTSHPIETSSLPVTEPPVYLNPDPMASIQRRPAYQYQLHPLPECLQQSRPVFIRGGDAASDDGSDPLYSPPSSNPVSPVPSSSPELVAIPELDVAIPAVLLPLRKRSKMILKSMESEVAAVRYSSVIHYAKAS
uniref:Kruppel-like protein 1 isoform A n=1 Tax=Nilaparvata lugens TaxID=108931 RepID=A0A1D9CG72_NILLU|nr:kruppel-like protein 1 isoform A [Nilaparvata lugens]